MSKSTVNDNTIYASFAFDKMINNTYIEATVEHREQLKTDAGSEYTRWWYIKSINDDGTMTICNDNHFVIYNVNINHFTY